MVLHHSIHTSLGQALGNIFKQTTAPKYVAENASHTRSPPPLQKSLGEHQNKASPSLSLSVCHLPLPAVPSRSPAKLGGRCCCAKLALKCLPGSPVSPTTQSNHIRSLYLCLGQFRHCSCVHPRSTFGVEGPPAQNVRPYKKNKKKPVSLSFCVPLSLFYIC